MVACIRTHTAPVWGSCPGRMNVWSWLTSVGHWYMGTMPQLPPRPHGTKCAMRPPRDANTSTGSTCRHDDWRYTVSRHCPPPEQQQHKLSRTATHACSHYAHPSPPPWRLRRLVLCWPPSSLWSSALACRSLTSQAILTLPQLVTPCPVQLPRWHVPHALVRDAPALGGCLLRAPW